MLFRSSVDARQSSRRSISENQTLQELLKIAGELEGKTKELRARKSSLLGRLNSPEKLAKEERLSAFDEVYQLDSILARYETFASQLAQVSDVQSTKNIGSLTPIPKEKLNGLVAQSKILCRLLQAEDALDSKDVILTISLVESVGNRLGIVEKVARMYQAFLERMGYKLQCVDDQHGDKPIIDRICFLVSGPGAWTALQQEQGLHVFRKGNDENKQRETASVDLVSLDAEAGEAFAKECSFRTQRTKGSMRLSGKSRVKFELAHRGTNTALSVAFDSSPNEARVLLLPWLETLARNQSNLERDNSADDQTMKETVVRRYDLGPSGLVRDTASGQRSGHVDKVLAGELERCIPWLQ